MNLNNDWSLVFHQVTPRSIEVWVGVLVSHVRKPNAQLIVKTADGTVIQSHPIDREHWQRPYANINTRFCQFITLEGLAPNTRYDVELTNNDVSQNKTLTMGIAHTLGESLSDYDDGFTVLLGSCFFEDKDNHNVSQSFETLHNGSQRELAPHISFLTGDQVYLDIGFDSLNPIKRDIRERIAGDYAKHWRALSGVFRHGGNWFLADDHEFWNGYPHVGASPFIQSLRIPSVKATWKKTAMDGVKNIQRIEPVRTFDLGLDLSFCIADLRTHRTKTKFIKDVDFSSIINWLQELRSPGVLVIPQPLIVAPSSSETNLASFKRQYETLLAAIAAAAHDVLVLSGDIHYGRVSSVPIGDNGRTLHEIVSSPMSNLTYVSSFATSYGNFDDRHKTFPTYSISNLPPKDIKYGQDWTVPSAPKSGFLDFTYLQRRTKEHFMTLNFQKTATGINVNTQAWLVRERDCQNYPKKSWSAPISLTLT